MIAERRRWLSKVDVLNPCLRLGIMDSVTGALVGLVGEVG